MGFLQVLLLILKILGILFASVIVLLLIAAALLLFVPVRYRLEGHKAEDYAVEARLSWLLRILRVRVKYASESKLFYEVRLLWFLLLSNDEAWKATHEEKKKKKAAKKAQKAERKKQKQKEKRAKKKAKLQKKKAAKRTTNKTGVSEKNVPQIPGKSGADGAHVQDSGADSDTQNLSSVETEPTAEEASQSTGEEKKNWFIRICDKIKSVITKVINKLKTILDTVKVLWHKVDTVITFLKDETNKAAFGASWATLIQLLKHIGPTKIQGYLSFGTDDPATTGYILAVLGIFYGKFGKSFSIQPNFEEKQFETELRAKGRIRFSRVLRLAWKLWKNKDFKSLLDNVKQLKADIKTNGG